jgi:hypothetical protein
MRIQVIDEHGVLWSDHPVGIRVDPVHGLCDLCEKPTPVLFDVAIYPADDYPILRCHGCIGDGAPGQRLVGAATARVPDGGDIYIVDPHGYVRLPGDRAQSLAGELAEHLAQVPPPPPRPQPPDRPLWPLLARLAGDLPVSLTPAAHPPEPPAGDRTPAPEPAPVAPAAPAEPLLARAEVARFGGPVACGSAQVTWFEVVAPDTPGQPVWNGPATAAAGERALLIGNPAAGGYAVTGQPAALERFVGALMARLRVERVASGHRQQPSAVAFDPAKARSWLAAQAETLELTGDYTPEANIASRLEVLVHELARGAHPEVWHTAADVSDVVVRPTASGESDFADFGAVLVVNVGAVYLVTHPLSAEDLTGLPQDPGGPWVLPWIDAAGRALTAAAREVNDVVARWRFATGQTLPRGEDQLAYDGWSNNPPKRPLTARERDLLVRILRDVAAAASSPSPTMMAVAPAELALLTRVREVLDPRTD